MAAVDDGNFGAGIVIAVCIAMRPSTRSSLGGHTLFIALVISIAPGCSGSIHGEEGTPPGTGKGPGAIPGPGPTPAGQAASCTIMPQRIYRLTPAQLQNTFLGLLGSAAPDKRIVADLQANVPPTQPFSNGEQILSNNLGVTETLLTALGDAATRASKTPNTLAPCFSKGITRACVAEMLNGLGKKAWRRPWTKDEQTTYLDFFDANVKASNSTQALEFVLQRMLIAPDVLFRFELGEPTKTAGAFALTPYEVASALSYGLTDGPPDAELMQAAADNKLKSAEEVRAASARILKSAKLSQGVQAFFEDFVSQGKPSPNADFPEQASRFIEHALWQDGGSLSKLLSANYTFVNPALAKSMGATVTLAEGAWTKFSPKSEADTAGFLTLGLVLGRHTNQSARGRFLSERMLCTPVPDPPNDVAADLETAKKTLEASLGRKVTDTEARQQHVSNPSCAFCHKILDPLGQPFAAYDRMGMWRATDADTQKPFATSTTFDVAPLQGPVANARELGLKLAGSQAVKSCFAGHVFEYLQGRKLSDADECHVAQLANSKAGTSGDVLGLFAEAVASDAFRFRTAPADR